MNPDDLSIEQQLAIAAMAARTGFDEDALMGVATNPAHPGFADLWEHLKSQGIQSNFGQRVSAAEAMDAGYHSEWPYILDNGLPWMGRDPAETEWPKWQGAYNYVTDRDYIWPDWRKQDRDQAKYRLVDIEDSLSKPQGPQFTQQVYTFRQLDLAKGGPFYSNFGTIQSRAAGGQFGKEVGHEADLKDKLAAVVREALVRNYKEREQIGTVTGTLLRSVSEATVEQEKDDQEGFVIKVTPKELKRDARQNEPAQVSTLLYSSSIFLGHRAILPRQQRYLRFKLDQGSDKWITTRNVRPVQGKNIFQLSDDQIATVRNAVVKSYARSIKFGNQY